MIYYLYIIYYFEKLITIGVDMKVVVLVKQVPDTYEKRQVSLDTGLLAREASENVVDEIDERVCAVAADLKKEGIATEVVAVGNSVWTHGV